MNDTGALQRRVDDVAKQLDAQRNRLNIRYNWTNLFHSSFLMLHSSLWSYLSETLEMSG